MIQVESYWFQHQKNFLTTTITSSLLLSLSNPHISARFILPPPRHQKSPARCPPSTTDFGRLTLPGSLDESRLSQPTTTSRKPDSLPESDLLLIASLKGIRIIYQLLMEHVIYLPRRILWKLHNIWSGYFLGGNSSKLSLVSAMSAVKCNWFRQYLTPQTDRCESGGVNINKASSCK